VTRLRHVADFNPSAQEIASWSADTVVSFLPMEAIGENGSLQLDRARPLAEVTQGFTYLRDGDAAYAKITPCFENGKGALMSGLRNGVAFGTTELTVARPRQGKLLGAYLFRLFSSIPFRQLGEAEMYGAGGQKRVPDDFAKEFEAPLPPLHEQGGIVSFLDREVAKIEALIAEQQRLMELLREKRHAMIARAVARGLNPDTPMKPADFEPLGQVPDHWDVRTLSSLTSKITNGYVGPTRDILVEAGVRYLQSLHIKSNRIRFDVPYHVRPEWSAQHSKSVLEAGDVLIVQTGDIGQVAVVPPEYADCNCHALIILSPIRSEVSGKWISWYLNSAHGNFALLSIQTGALHPHLNCGNVKGLSIPLPPVAEQNQITEHIELRVSEFDVMEGQIEGAIALLQERRAALISAAVTGKIDVRDLVDAEAA
jgi:type I restriction enzyme S subunit